MIGSMIKNDHFKLRIMKKRYFSYYSYFSFLPLYRHEKTIKMNKMIKNDH